MTDSQTYSIAELSRCKLLHEASIKDRDLRRLVGHVNMYDRLLDILNAEDLTKTEQSAPKKIPSDAIATGIKLAGCQPKDKTNDKSLEHVADLVATEKDMDVGFGVHCEDVSRGSQDIYSVVSVAEVELSEDDD